MILKKWKTASDIIVSWITIVGLVGGGVYTILEYQNYQNERRIERALSYSSVFRSPPFTEHREALTKQWRQDQEKILAILTDRNVSQAEINGRYSDFILETLGNNRLHHHALEELSFFEEIARCVDSGLCDRSTTLSILGKYGKLFFRQYYPYICDLRAKWNDLTIGDALESLFNPSSLGKACGTEHK